jgi:hypothetical protein
MNVEAAKAKDKSRVTYQGVLEIDYDNGTIIFTSGGIRVFRVTHLREPIPKGVSIDIVALDALTSYTPMEVEAPDNVQSHRP